MEIILGKVSWNLKVFENFQYSDWLIQWSHDLKWDFEGFQAYLKLLEVMDPYRTLFDSLFETFLISKVSNNTSHLKSHLKVSNNQQMRLETRCAISALHKVNWLPCLIFGATFLSAGGRHSICLCLILWGNDKVDLGLEPHLCLFAYWLPRSDSVDSVLSLCLWIFTY